MRAATARAHACLRTVAARAMGSNATPPPSAKAALRQAVRMALREAEDSDLDAQSECVGKQEV